MNIKKFLLRLASALFFLLPAQALAIGVIGNNAVDSGLHLSGLGTLFGSTGLASAQTLPDLLVTTIDILLILAGMIAVLFVIIGGFQYLTSAGNEEQAEKGKKSLINAIIGIVVVILSYTIIQVIVNTVSGGSFGGI